MDTRNFASSPAAFALLSAVLPTLQRSDIVNTRVLRLRRLEGVQRADVNAKNLARRRSALPSIVARLAGPGLVRVVMRAKCALANNYLTTDDVRQGVLGPESAACLTGQKVFINEMLSQEKFLLFKNWRPIAQGLGFKYVWHADGRFLARRTSLRLLPICKPFSRNLANILTIIGVCNICTIIIAVVTILFIIDIVFDALHMTVREYLTEHPSYDVFGFAETWLGPIMANSLVDVAGYTIIRQDRNVNGGGVALFVRNGLKINKLASSGTLGTGKPRIPEYLFCSVQRGDSPPVLLRVIYRPLKIPMQKNSDLFSVLRDLCGDFSHKIIMGDLNSDLLSGSDDAATIKYLSEELSLQIIRHVPRITPHHLTLGLT
ncbi:hypothetical protein TSAR_005098 [Trichomalopsis sarcophagae]|uniref:Endonuclease/exonuclease/phosphatase domain-containing protein n=1 Tax=Trichomalopsis sarcophagae TaxID=543379 RepID=A0A232FMJ2_9HYME|nr:hypothetical protein TSAR_005098 [Trichomalopsis sarcophagae]